MSIADKLKQIAENQQNVYDAGYSAGQQAGSGSSGDYDTGYEAGYADGEITGYQNGYSVGYGDGETEVTEMLCSLTRRKGTELNCNAIVFGEYACYGWTELITARLPVARYFSKYSFRNCTGLTTMDIGDPTRTDIYPSSPSSSWYFANFAFNGATALETLILRPNVVATLQSTSVFATCPITSGTGYIYVPSALAEDYKATTYWSTYADQFRALEDYTVDGTTTGELDESKI